ncbi:hypothetical protein D3C79_1050790 [compost metagenome]
MRREQLGLRMVRIIRLVQIHRHHNKVAAVYERLCQSADPRCDINSGLSHRQAAVHKIIGEVNYDQGSHRGTS